MVLQSVDMEDAMPQTVPSAGFTPPCDYTNFAENFDLSLLPGGDPVSPSTQFYAQSPSPLDFKRQLTEPKIFTTFYPDSCDKSEDLDFRPDFQKLLDSDSECDSPLFSASAISNIYLEVPSNNFQINSPNPSLSPSYSHQSLLSPNDNFNAYRESNFYPSSPELSLYVPSPNSIYSRSPRDDCFSGQFIKNENPFSVSPLPSLSPFHIKEESFLSPCGFPSPTSPSSTIYSNISSPEQIAHHQENVDVLNFLETSVLDKQIKQEKFETVINNFQDNRTLRSLLNADISTSISEPPKPKDHQLLREVLRDTSFQKKFNIKPIEIGFFEQTIKMEEPEESAEDLMSCEDEITRENIEPVLNLAIEQMRKEVDKTCATLGISTDPLQWNTSNVFSWVQWTSREFGLPDPAQDQWDISGSGLVILSEEDFTRRSPQGGMILHAQLEIWKAAYSNEDLGMQWLPESTPSNESSRDISEDEDEETSSQPDPVKPTTSRSGSHIHLWQFLKELLASPQTYGSCIRWLDRTKGIFKIEDSVKVAKLWGKRKNRPAMNYDKLSRSIRQYYKKGIMKKTERSQRLVYQFCHPYNL